MDAVETTKKLFERIESGDTGAASELLTSDFVFSGPVPEPVDGKMWLGLHDRLNAAFPDFSFNSNGAELMGDKVKIELQLSGTHQSELDLSPMGLPDVPATGKSFQLPTEVATVRFTDGKISSVDVAKVEGGGLMGILAQLGVEVPTQ